MNQNKSTLSEPVKIYTNKKKYYKATIFIGKKGVFFSGVGAIWGEDERVVKDSSCNKAIQQIDDRIMILWIQIYIFLGKK